jgi:hypothetical protein
MQALRHSITPGGSCKRREIVEVLFNTSQGGRIAKSEEGERTRHVMQDVKKVLEATGPSVVQR